MSGARKTENIFIDKYIPKNIFQELVGGSEEKKDWKGISLGKTAKIQKRFLSPRKKIGLL